MSRFVCFSLVFVLSGLRFRSDAEDLFSRGLSPDFPGGGENIRGGVAGTSNDNSDVRLPVNEETGRSRKSFKVIISMLIMLKLTALMVITLVMIKFLLLVAALATKVAILVSGFALAKHLVSYGLAALAKHVFIPFGYSHGHYKNTGLDLSGYGYNSYKNEHLIPNYVRPEYLSSTQTPLQYFGGNYSYS